MSLFIHNLGKESPTEEFLVKKMALLHTKRRKLKDKKMEEEKQKIKEQSKPATLTKQETILAAKRILQAEAMKRDEREKNKKSGFKRSCKFERNRTASKKVVKARPLSLEDSPEQKMQEKVPERTPPDKEFIPNLPYFDHDQAKTSGNLLQPMKSTKEKYSNFVSSNSKRKLVQYDDSLDIQ
ncbi:hypothetical protein ACHWQZ_G004564 [Mnemiopsis leidyi]